MKIGHFFRGGLFALIMVVLLAGCGPKKYPIPKASLYTRYNIHVQDKVLRNGGHVDKASYANYTDPGAGHLIIPAGSKIQITRITSREFDFFVPKKGMKVRFEYNEPRMKMSVDHYLEKITSTSPVSLDRLSKLDRRGVAQGKALVGMSRKGVMTALGYPATHRTPSLKASYYVYWTNRFGTIAVEFDSSGHVKKVVQ